VRSRGPGQSKTARRKARGKPTSLHGCLAPSLQHTSYRRHRHRPDSHHTCSRALVSRILNKNSRAKTRKRTASRNCSLLSAHSPDDISITCWVAATKIYWLKTNCVERFKEELKNVDDSAYTNASWLCHSPARRTCAVRSHSTKRAYM
jgi:hypothetical protein